MYVDLRVIATGSLKGKTAAKTDAPAVKTAAAKGADLEMGQLENQTRNDEKTRPFLLILRP